ncbi:MAG: hypothetical protein KatS3mg032_0389 [Cyclobacteriaceae bacterium]|nr:MAG: hypothetical protein KatS3mg032_0389 [Cyclobacteriaceae bacterium]
MIRYFALLTVTLFLNSCFEEASPEKDKRAFTRIFDHNDFGKRFKPVDFLETSDGGYLILAEYNLNASQFSGIYLLRSDQNGQYLNGIMMDETLVNPAGNLMKLGSGYCFFAMDPLTVQAYLIQTNEDLTSISSLPINGITYPAAASADNNYIILLSYDPVNLQTVLSTLNSSGTVTASKAFSIGAGEGVEEPVINHYLRTGKQFPFFTGKAGNLYYFNGFYNYTFSLVFTDLVQDNPQGIVQGNQDDGGFQALLPLQGNAFAAARFNFGDNYLLPRINLSASGITSATDLGGLTFPEIAADATVRILRASINNTNVLVFGSDTRSGQIGLYLYDEATGELLTTRYEGFANPFKLSAIRLSGSGDLLLCGTTYLAGRFPRIFLTKIPQQELQW